MYFVLLFPSIGQWTICWWLGQRYSLIYILRFEKPFKTTALKIVFLRNKKIVKKKKSSISFSYFLPRLILPMQVVCGSVLRVGYMNANINLLGTGGTARTPRYNFPQLKALEVVRYVHNWIVYLLLFFFFFLQSLKNKRHIYTLYFCSNERNVICPCNKRSRGYVYFNQKLQSRRFGGLRMWQFEERQTR